MQPDLLEEGVVIVVKVRCGLPRPDGRLLDAGVIFDKVHGCIHSNHEHDRWMDRDKEKDSLAEKNICNEEECCDWSADRSPPLPTALQIPPHLQMENSTGWNATAEKAVGGW